MASTTDDAAGNSFDLADGGLSGLVPSSKRETTSRRNIAIYLSITLALGLAVGTIGCLVLGHDSADVSSVNPLAGRNPELTHLLDQPLVQAQLQMMMANPDYFEEQAKRVVGKAKASGEFLPPANQMSQALKMLRDPKALSGLKKMIANPKFKQKVKRLEEAEARGNMGIVASKTDGANSKALSVLGLAFGPASMRSKKLVDEERPDQDALEELRRWSELRTMTDEPLAFPTMTDEPFAFPTMTNVGDDEPEEEERTPVESKVLTDMPPVPEVLPVPRVNQKDVAIVALFGAVTAAVLLVPLVAVTHVTVTHLGV